MFQAILTAAVSVAYFPIYLILVGTDKIKEKLDI